MSRNDERNRAPIARGTVGERGAGSHIQSGGRGTSGIRSMIPVYARQAVTGPPIDSIAHGVGDSSRAQASVLQSARQVGIRGGNFNTAGTQQLNFTFHLGEERSERDLEQRVAGPNRARAREEALPNRYCDDGGLTPWPPNPPVQRSCDIYYRHIAVKGRGSPLWIPGPNQSLYIGYQRQGMAIGDVGIITAAGSFDFLFNICLPHDHPFNPPELPENFTPIPLSPHDIHVHSEFEDESYLSSASVKKSRNGAVNGLTFESSASEGAVLTMPVGSNSEDIANISKFRRYLAANAEYWYRYILDIRGREPQNGDVRLVTGWDKTKAWGMATFSNTTAEQEPFLLQFRPIEHGVAGMTYGWDYSGFAEVRAGPGAREKVRIRMDDPSQDGVEYENQCLFIRTLNVNLQNKVWKKLASEFGLAEAGGGPSYTFDTSHSRSSGKGNNRDSGSSSSASSASQSAFTSGTDCCTAATAFANADASTPRRTNSVHFSPLKTIMTGHPAKGINEIMLQLKPAARMAITEDNDWISVLREDDTILPPAEQLYERIMESAVLCEEEDVVFLLQKKTSEEHNNYGLQGLVDFSPTTPESLNAITIEMATVPILVNSFSPGTSGELSKAQAMASTGDPISAPHAGLSLTRPFSTARGIKVHLKNLLNSKEEQLQHAGSLGQRVLSQKLELEALIKHLQDLEEDKGEHDDIDYEARQRYRELEDTINAWDFEIAQLSGPFNSMRFQNGSSSQPVVPYSDLPQGAKIPGSGSDGVGYTLISNSLLADIRRLQNLVGDRDESIKNMQAIIEQGALGGQRQREMLVEPPTSSFENLANASTRSVSMLAQLMNRNPDIFPISHPDRRGFSSGEISPTGGVDVTPMQPLTSTALAIPEPALAAENVLNQGAARTSSESMLAQLMNRNPDIFSISHPDRRGFSSGEISPTGGADMTLMQPLTSTALAIPEPALAAENVLNQVANDEVTRPPPYLGRITTSGIFKIAGASPAPSLHKLSPPSRAVGLRLQTESAAALPMSWQALAGSASAEAPPLTDLTSAILTNGVTSGEYRPKGPLEEEGNDSETGIRVSSVAQERLKALAERSRNLTNAGHDLDRVQPQNPEVGSPHGDDNDVPQWARISQPKPLQQHTRGQSQNQPQNPDSPDGLQFMQANNDLPNYVARLNPAPISLGYPYNFPVPKPPSTPRTTRRLMLSTELTESMRRNLLWEKTASGGGSRHITLNKIQPPGSPNDDRKSGVNIYEEEVDAKKRKVMARNNTWS